MQIIKKYKHLALIAVAVVLIGAGCTAGVESDRIEKDRVEEQQRVYVDSQQIPFFDWSLERHIFIELYEARNNAVTTYSYIRNLNGQVVFSCKSIGFPIPANTQLTNPEKAGNYGNGGSFTLPQPEPNGLFSSPSTVGTYVFCLNDNGTVSPSYFEAEVETHLSPLDDSGRNLQGKPELEIDTKRE